MARDHLKHHLIIPSLVRPCQREGRLGRRPLGQVKPWDGRCRGREASLGLLWCREAACRCERPGAKSAALNPRDLAQDSKMVRHDVSGDRAA